MKMDPIWVGLSLCELSEKDGGYVVDSVLETYSNSVNAEAYQKIFDGTYFDPAIQKNDRSSVISYASLTSGNENKDDDENETYTVEITPDATSIEAGAEVTLTATVKKGNTIVSNLQEAD